MTFYVYTTAAQVTLFTVNVSAESVDGSTPAVRVTWNTTVPPQCVTSVTVEFKINKTGPVVVNYTTTGTSGTVIQTGLQCRTYYYVSVLVNIAAFLDAVRIFPTLRSREVQVWLAGGKVSHCQRAWEST